MELPDHPGQAVDQPYPLLRKSLVTDLIPGYSLTCGTKGKLEGMALTPAGRFYLVADDDGKGTAMLLQLRLHR